MKNKGLRTFLVHCLVKPKWYHPYETQRHGSCIVSIPDTGEVMYQTSFDMLSEEAAVMMEKQNEIFLKVLSFSEFK